jgi:hypothetical protein
MLSIHQNDDASYEAALKSGAACIYNDFPGHDPRYKKLHRSDCRTLQSRPGLRKTSVRKVCSDSLDELVQWLLHNRGPEGTGYTLCPVCMRELQDTTRETKVAAEVPTEVPSLSFPARSFARKLIEVYQDKKIPLYSHHFSRAGFTREALEADPTCLFQLIVIAAYDRQPFTRVTRGWEPIWGLRTEGDSLPRILTELGVFELERMSGLAEEDIHQRLAQGRFYRYRLDTDGAFTRYAQTLIDAAKLVTSGLHRRLLAATDERDALTIFRDFDTIHGIGPTIASKLVMYTLREIGVGNVQPRDFTAVVEPIIEEYHNARMAKKLRGKYGPTCLRQLYEELSALGDPFAIDALYYVDRDAPELQGYLLEGLEL